MNGNSGYLIDTHIWLWWHIDPDKLSSKSFGLIERAETPIYFSVVSAWEIVIKHSVGKLRLPYPPYTYVPKRLEVSHMDVLQVQLEHVLKVQNLPDHHKDPFDRLLIAQALAENLTIISNDRQLRDYTSQIVW